MADDWAMLLTDIPGVLNPDRGAHGEVVRPQRGEFVQLRDSVGGQRILFYPDEKGIAITVSVPDDQGAATRLRSVLRSQRTTSFSRGRDYESGGMRPLEESVWHPLPGSARAVTENCNVGEPKVDSENLAREWRTGWRYNAGYREEIAAAIVAVIRDGLGSAPTDLRLCAYDDAGPARAPRLGSVVSDQPTSRGAARCTGWDDFTDRLGWVLTTLPCQGYLDLPITGTSLLIQLSKGQSGDVIDGELWNEKWANPGPPELHDPLVRLGWRWGTPDYLIDHPDNRKWMGPRTGSGTANPTMHSLAARAVATLRTIGGISDPNMLEFRAFVNGAEVQELPYVGKELGLSDA
ncbi:hypothetical protein [Nocardia sp. SYP-A9097]|uniref:TY-Chap domain-containing protein n=1 Tax=Nocardia sp. SYP-A9097 TaxID=2663237 RepID=UPI0035C90792